MTEAIGLKPNIYGIAVGGQYLEGLVFKQSPENYGTGLEQYFRFKSPETSVSSVNMELVANRWEDGGNMKPIFMQCGSSRTPFSQ